MEKASLERVGAQEPTMSMLPARRHNVRSDQRPSLETRSILNSALIGSMEAKEGNRHV